MPAEVWGTRDPSQACDPRALGDAIPLLYLPITVLEETLMTLLIRSQSFVVAPVLGIFIRIYFAANPACVSRDTSPFEASDWLFQVQGCCLWSWPWPLVTFLPGVLNDKRMFNPQAS
jgi:hypothetical protein